MIGRSMRGSRFATLAILAALVAPAVGTAQSSNPGVLRTVALKGEINELCALIRREIGRLPVNTGIEDAEAAIVFALSQANPRMEVIDPALTCAGAGETRQNVLQAIENVRRSYRRSGTGAIDIGARGGADGASFFSPPIIGIGGGGGANYSAR